MSQETIKFRDLEIPAVSDREFQIQDLNIIDEEKGIVEFSLTSEEPYERWYGVETLIHTKESVVLDRVYNGSAHILENHDPNKFLGNILEARVDEKAKKTRVKAQFELDNPYDTRGNKIWHRVKNGTLKTVSGGYRYIEYEEKEVNRQWHLVVTKWELIEGSFTPTPADYTVGVGRSIDNSQSERSNWEELEQRTNDMEQSTQESAMGEEGQGNTLEVTREDLTAERERSQQIFATGQKFNVPELAQKALREGWSVAELHSQILQKQSQQKPLAKTTDPLGMSEQEQQRYSFQKAIQVAAKKRGFSESCFEKEIHDELVKRARKANPEYRESENVLIPVHDLGVSKQSVSQGWHELSRQAALRTYLNTLYQRDLQVGDPVFGGNLVETELLAERFIDIYRNKSVLRRMGMQSLTGLIGNVDIPKQTAGAIDGNYVYWVAENTDVGKIDAQFGLVKFRPKNVGSYMYVTRSMLLHSSIGMDNFIRRELAIALALGMDKAGLTGTGTNDEPLGIFNTPGVNNVIFGADGGAPDWARLVQFETKIAVENADEETMGWICNAKTRGELKSRPKFDNTSNETLWQMAAATNNQGYINGYRVGVSNQIPSNLTKGTGTGLSAIALGSWNNLVCAEWGTYELAADPYDQFLSGGVRVRIIHTCDIGVLQEKAFSVATDLATPLSDAA